MTFLGEYIDLAHQFPLNSVHRTFSPEESVIVCGLFKKLTCVLL